MQKQWWKGTVAANVLGTWREVLRTLYHPAGVRNGGSKRLKREGRAGQANRCVFLQQKVGRKRVYAAN